MTKRPSLAGPLFILFMVPIFAWPQQSPDRYKTELQPLLEKVIKEQQIPGFAIAVVESNHVAYAHGFSFKNLDNKIGEDARVTPLSLFHMASITKPFVATSIMQLVEAGKLDLDAPVVKYLPYFQMADERYKTLTVRQMVTHTSGMPDVNDYEWDKPQYDDGALERYVRSLRPLQLEFPAGAKFQYSNMAFEVLGDVIAKVSGESFDDYVQHHILTPMVMTKSTLLYNDVDKSLLTSGHILNADGDPIVSKVFPYNRMHSPSSNLHSNVLDMSRWAIANMNRGELDGRRILKASTYDVMWKPAFESKDLPGSAIGVRAVGISWFLGEYRGHALVTHTGGDTGYATDLALLPDEKVAVVWMCNCDWILRSPITRSALDVALGQKPGPISMKREIASAMYSALMDHGIDASIESYKRLKRLKPGMYDFGEDQLEGLSKYLVSTNRPKDAIRVLELDSETFPRSANAFDKLGEAYEQSGDKTQAVASYQKALQLNPKLSHASEALRKLQGQNR